MTAHAGTPKPASGSFADMVRSFAVDWRPTEDDPLGAEVTYKLWLDCSHPTIERTRDHIAQVTWHRNGSRRIRFGHDYSNFILHKPSAPWLASAPHGGFREPARSILSTKPTRRIVTPPDPAASAGSGISQGAYIIRCPHEPCVADVKLNFARFWTILDAARHAAMTELNIPDLR